mmetsp:Transcript_38221/g.108015  ORF Transcript_38221/g.108015 Transcript_38221/m.108015 type:complete len:677 (-) Transcript_38221:60-2090(-)
MKNGMNGAEVVAKWIKEVHLRRKVGVETDKAVISDPPQAQPKVQPQAGPDPGRQVQTRAQTSSEDRIRDPPPDSMETGRLLKKLMAKLTETNQATAAVGKDSAATETLSAMEKVLRVMAEKLGKGAEDFPVRKEGFGRDGSTALPKSSPLLLEEVKISASHGKAQGPQLLQEIRVFAFPSHGEREAAVATRGTSGGAPRQQDPAWPGGVKAVMAKCSPLASVNKRPETRRTDRSQPAPTGMTFESLLQQVTQLQRQLAKEQERSARLQAENHTAAAMLEAAALQVELSACYSTGEKHRGDGGVASPHGDGTASSPSRGGNCPAAVTAYDGGPASSAAVDGFSTLWRSNPLAEEGAEAEDRCQTDAEAGVGTQDEGAAIAQQDGSGSLALPVLLDRIEARLVAGAIKGALSLLGTVEEGSLHAMVQMADKARMVEGILEAVEHQLKAQSQEAAIYGEENSRPNEGKPAAAVQQVVEGTRTGRYLVREEKSDTAELDLHRHAGTQRGDCHEGENSHPEGIWEAAGEVAELQRQLSAELLRRTEAEERLEQVRSEARVREGLLGRAEVRCSELMGMLEMEHRRGELWESVIGGHCAAMALHDAASPPPTGSCQASTAVEAGSLAAALAGHKHWEVPEACTAGALAKEWAEVANQMDVILSSGQRQRRAAGHVITARGDL